MRNNLKVLTIDPSAHDGSIGRPPEIIQQEAKYFLKERKNRIMSNKDRSNPRPTPTPDWDD